MTEQENKQVDNEALKAKLDSLYTKLEKTLPLLDRDAGDWPTMLQSSFTLFKAINKLEEETGGVNPYLSFSSILNTATAKVPELARVFAQNYAMRIAFYQLDDQEQGRREEAYKKAQELFKVYNQDHPEGRIGFYAILKAADEDGQARVQEQLQEALGANAELFDANEKLLKRAKEQQAEIDALRKEREERRKIKPKRSGLLDDHMDIYTRHFTARSFDTIWSDLYANLDNSGDLSDFIYGSSKTGTGDNQKPIPNIKDSFHDFSGAAPVHHSGHGNNDRTFFLYQNLIDRHDAMARKKRIDNFQKAMDDAKNFPNSDDIYRKIVSDADDFTGKK